MQNNLTDFLHTFPAQLVTMIIVAALWAILMPKKDIDGEDRYKAGPASGNLAGVIHNDANSWYYSTDDTPAGCVHLLPFF